MELTLFVVADYANITNDNKINIIGIFNRILAEEFPAAHRSLYLVAQLAASSAEANLSFTLEVQMVGKDDQKIFSLSNTTVVPESTDGSPIALNVIIQIVDILIPESGTYPILLLVNEQIIGSLNIVAVRI